VVGAESGLGSSPTSPPAARSATAWTESLEQAKVDLVGREFGRALLRAETVLRQDAPPGVRAAALLLAADSAYGLRAYTRASERYGEFLSMYDLAAEAPQATLALGWAEFRLGHVDRARATWAQLARRYPRDVRAPLALLLAAEAANLSGNDRAAGAQLDLVLERYPAGPVAEVARLSRAVLAARQAREDDATRDLRELVRADQVCAAQARRTLRKMLTEPGREEPLARVTHLGCARPVEVATPLERFAAPLLDGAGDPETTPLVLRGLVGLAADDGRWAEVRTLSTRLIDGYQAYPGTPELLTRVATRAASDRQWPVARDLYVLRARYRDAPLDTKARIEFAEVLFHTGELDAARVELGRIIGDNPGDPEQAPRALFLLGEVTEALGHPQDALALYERLVRDYPGTEGASESLLPRARLLQAMGRTREARPLLETVVQGADDEAFAEAAFRLAQISAVGGEPAAAVKWYLTAASAGTGSAWGPRALLGAVQSLAGTGDRTFAEAIYRRLQASDAVDPELLADARKALESVRNRPDHGR
jgi:TolA-binding protein